MSSGMNFDAFYGDVNKVVQQSRDAMRGEAVVNPPATEEVADSDPDAAPAIVIEDESDHLQLNRDPSVELYDFPDGVEAKELTPELFYEVVDILEEHGHEEGIDFIINEDSDRLMCTDKINKGELIAQGIPVCDLY